MSAKREFGVMKGQKVLVTGAGTGIGRGVAIEFSRAGADVVLRYFASSEEAESAAEAINSSGGCAKAIGGDFRDIRAVKETARLTIEFLGGIDVLVNNAGITANAPFDEITPELFDTLINVNLRAQIFLTQAVLPVMERARKGVAVNLTSIHAFTALTEHAVYAATKAAIVAYTRMAALELIQKGVRMNAIAPGWIWVENHRSTLGEAFDTESAEKNIPRDLSTSPRISRDWRSFSPPTNRATSWGRRLFVMGARR